MLTQLIMIDLSGTQWEAEHTAIHLHSFWPDQARAFKSSGLMNGNQNHVPEPLPVEWWRAHPWTQNAEYSNNARLNTTVWVRIVIISSRARRLNLNQSILAMMIKETRG